MRKCKIPSARYEYVSSYERTAQKLLVTMPKPKKFGKLYLGRFLSGHQSSHKTQAACIWRTFWRIKTIGLTIIA